MRRAAKLQLGSLAVTNQTRIIVKLIILYLHQVPDESHADSHTGAMYSKRRGG